jgi:hypothetical protein
MRALWVLTVCVGLLGLGGCGGGDDSASSTSETTPVVSAVQPSPRSSSAQREKSKQAKDKSSNAKGEDPEQRPSNGSRKSSPKPVRVPAISSAPIAGSKTPAPGVKTVKGADNSVQEYGVEADESTRRQAAIALAAYLNARAEEDWPSACSLLAQRPIEQLQRLQGAAAKQGKELGGCAATMAFLKEGEARSLEQAQITEVLSFRGEGDVPGNPSYLIFTGPPGQTLFSMPMYWEGGVWKVGLARAAELPLG